MSISVDPFNLDSGKLITSDYIKLIEPVVGVNPVDSGPITLYGHRGRLEFTITSLDNMYSSMFLVVGGTGEDPNQPSRNYFFKNGSNTNCIVNTVAKNQIEILTDVADAGGRRYVVSFKPFGVISITIEQTSGNTIGNSVLRVAIRHFDIVFLS